MNLALPKVIQEHANEAAFLLQLRKVVCQQPHQTLGNLARLDERLRAHLDGLQTCRPASNAIVTSALEAIDPGVVFVAAVRALEDLDAARLENLLRIAEVSPLAFDGINAAFAWVSPQQLGGTIKTLLESGNPCRQRIGISACAAHQVDSRSSLGAFLLSADVLLRQLSLRLAGEQGRIDLQQVVCTSVADPDSAIRLHAAIAGLYLASEGLIPALRTGVLSETSDDTRLALPAFFKACLPSEARDICRQLALMPSRLRVLVRAIGIAGDTHYVPWLIQQMRDTRRSRLCGESFSLITGLDLEALHLDRATPDDAESSANDDPNDDNVAMDEDDGLPWPDQGKIHAWWQANSSRFRPGTRYFMGQPPTFEHCFSVLRTGFQRQRRHAAEYLCLLRPGTPMFNIAAPAWRQKRLLAQMAGN